MWFMTAPNRYVHTHSRLLPIRRLLGQLGHPRQLLYHAGRSHGDRHLCHRLLWRAAADLRHERRLEHELHPEPMHRCVHVLVATAPSLHTPSSNRAPCTFIWPVEFCPALTSSYYASWPLTTVTGTFATGTCIAGYQGTPQRECRASFGWQAPSPTCTRKRVLQHAFNWATTPSRSIGSPHIGSAWAQQILNNVGACAHVLLFHNMQKSSAPASCRPLPPTPARSQGRRSAEPATWATRAQQP